MTRNHDDQSAIRRYLLRQLTDDQQQETEQRLLVEDDFFEELETTEAQLADEYVAGKLTEAEREQFEQHFLTTPRRQQDVQFARAFRRYVAVHPVQKTQRAGQSWWQVWDSQSWVLRAAAAVVAVTAIAVAVWFFLPRASAPDTFATLSLTLSAGNRAESVRAPRIPLPPNALKIVLKLPDTSRPATSYRVKLLSGDGEMRTLEIAGRDAQTVSVVIPAAQLKRGPYALKLLALNADGTEQPVNGSYLFAIE